MNQGQVWLFYVRVPEPKQGTASPAGLFKLCRLFPHAQYIPDTVLASYATSNQPTDEVLLHDHQECSEHQGNDDGH